MASEKLGEALVDVVGNLKPLDSALKKAESRMQSAGEKLSGIGSKLTKGLTVPIAAVGTALGGLIKQTSAYGAEVAESAAKTGMSAESYQELKFAMEEAGLSSDRVDRALGRLNQRMGKAEAGSKKYQDAFNELGVSWKDGSGQMRDTDDVFRDVIKNLGEMEDSSKQAALAGEIFGTNMGRQLLPMIQQGEEGMDAAIKKAREMGIVLSEDDVKAADELDAAMGDLSNAFTGAGRQIGAAFLPILADKLVPILRETVVPAIMNIVDRVKQWIDWFLNLDPAIQGVIIGVIAFLGAIGPVLVAVGKFTSIMSKLPGMMSMLTNPVGLIIAGIIALAAALIYAYNHSETFREIVNNAWERIKEGLQILWEFLQPLIQELVTFVREQFQKIKNWWDENGEQMIEAIMNIFQGIWEIIEPIILAIVELFKVVWPLISEILATAWETIKGIISGALDIIMGLVEVFISLFTGDWSGLWEGVKKILKGAGKIIVSLLKSSILGYMWKLIGPWVTKAVNKFLSFKDGVVNAFRTAKDKAVGAFQGLWSGIKRIINLVISGWNKMIGGLNKGVGIANKIPGVNVPTIPKIPMLAEGGLITAPTLAMVGEGRDNEAVVPLNRRVLGDLAEGIALQMAGGGGTTIHIHGLSVREEADVDRIAEAIERKRRREERFRG